MSSTPQKKMCKSPKNSINYQTLKPDKMEYENLSTTCTVMGSNNIHLVKKPQMVTSVSPAYSNPSPGYPPSPYSSPASLKSPSPSLKPPTPQPHFPVMQIIHNNQLLARPIQATQQQNIIKLKPQLNILPKPSASPQPSPKPSVSPQIVIPNQQATLMPPTQQLVLNQMPVLAPGVQLIFRPQTTKIPTQIPTATATPHGLILQPSTQQLLQLQPPRSQPMVRVLTNGVQLAPPTTTFVTHLSNQPQSNITTAQPTTPKKKPKKKKQKFDLADIMKISGIGDEDDIQFESDTSQNDNEPSAVQTSQPQTVIQHQTNMEKKIGNIQISTVAQPTINATATPLLQVLNQNFQSGMSAQGPPQASIPFNPFITPNFTINNGLMVQRSGGFKLTLGEDGRLVLQHDPTLNQDLQSQLLLQSILSLNGGLVLQPSMDQQIHSQTVQTIQQQSVQTIQQQTVQSQTIQTVQQQTVQPQNVQHSLQTIQPQIQTVQPQTVQQTVQQTIQHHTVQSQPLSSIQHSQPMQIVQPQPIQSLQPQIAHSIHSQVQPTVQNLQLQSLLQSQPLQTIQSQPQMVSHSVSQPMQNFHTHQSVQTQPVLKVQPFQKSQPPVHAVHPQPIQTIHHPPQQQHQHGLGDNQQSTPTSYVVNLTPEQLEQLKRNGQLTVNGQTIFMQRPNATSKIPEQVTQNNENKNKLSPKTKLIKKNNKIPASNVIKSILQDNVGIKNLNNVEQAVKDGKTSLIRALQSPPKHLITQNHVQPQQISHKQASIEKPHLPQIIAQKVQQKPQLLQQKVPVHPNTQNIVVNRREDAANGASSQDVERILGQLLEENNLDNIGSLAGLNQPQPVVNQQQQQRVHTIQLTPQKQQHLKSIQVQIQALLTRMTPGDTEIEKALKLMFAEQQKILASGKLLPPAIYHNNQLTIVNPNVQHQVTQVKSESGSGHGTLPVRSTVVETASTHQVATTQTQQVPRIVQNAPANEHHPHPVQASTVLHLPQPQPVTTKAVLPVSQHQPLQHPVQQHQVVHQPQPPVNQIRYMPAFTKAQLIEQQLNTDQNGAVKPDIHSPFRDKADACKRLIRYHCFDQPVLSQKDLNKADEIFELTAKHFIGKFSKMVDKYQCLLLKESMRHVQTSELMMLDRMFVAEEQQAVLRMRQEFEEASQSHFSPPPVLCNVPQPIQNCQQAPTNSVPLQQQSESFQEEYDEWACIQRELGCLQSAEEPKQAPKRSASSDSRLETLKRFRVEKHAKKSAEVTTSVCSQVSMACNVSQSVRNNLQCGNNYEFSGRGSDGAETENNSIDEQVQSAIDSILNLQQSTSLDLDDAVNSILS